jgi:hypothetical protein
MTKNILRFCEYTELLESLDLDVGTLNRDKQLEEFAKFSLPEESHDSIRAYYNQHMDATNLRLIKFEHPEGTVEYHLHSNELMPGTKSTNPSKKAFLSALKILHDDAKNEVDAGKSVKIQTMSKDQFAKYHMIASRLAKSAGRTVTDAGFQPLTTAPFMKGFTLTID